MSDQRRIRRLALLFTILTLLAAGATMAFIGLAFAPRDGNFVPVFVAGAITAVLGGVTIAIFRRLDD